MSKSDISKILVTSGLDTEDEEEESWTPLVRCTTTSSKPIRDLLHFYYNEEDVLAKLRQTRTMTPIYEAALNGQTEDLEELITRPSDITTTTQLQFSPLHAAAWAQNLPCARLLIAKGAPAHAVDAFRRTPLHFAARVGSFEIVKLLVENGAQVFYGEHEGHTALDDARLGDHLEIADYLLTKMGYAQMEQNRGV